MDDIYWGIDMGQIIIALLFLLVFAGFALWGYRNLHQRVTKVEKSMEEVHQVYRDIEPEGYEEEPEEPRPGDASMKSDALA